MPKTLSKKASERLGSPESGLGYRTEFSCLCPLGGLVGRLGRNISFRVALSFSVALTGPLWCTQPTSQPCALSFWAPYASWLWPWQPR